VPGRDTTFSLRLPLSTLLAQARLFKVGGQAVATRLNHDSSDISFFSSSALRTRA